MLVAGIVAEYNPFHKGHEFHIKKTRELTGADAIAVVLSGDFVQRGEPAIMDKFLRAQCALNCGADLVLELPVEYSLSSAEQFAAGAATILSALHADYLSFGSECGSIGKLDSIADILNREPDEFKLNLKNNLKAGMSYPKARDLALSAVHPEFSGILSRPNNTLGVEYIREIKRRDYPMQPVTILRKGSGYNDTVAAVGQFPSATAIRALLQKDAFERLTSFIPEPAQRIMEKNYHQTFPVTADDFSAMLYYRLTLLVQQNADLTEYSDVSPALANRIFQMVQRQNKPRTFYETADFLKTKELTYSRVMRCLMHILLDIRTSDAATPAYIRILGLNQTGKRLLSGIKKECPLPIITKAASAKNLLKKTAFAGSLYRQIILEKYHTTAENDYTHNIIRT